MLTLPKTHALVLGIVLTLWPGAEGAVSASPAVDEVFDRAQAPNLARAWQQLAEGQPAKALKALAEVDPELSAVARALTVEALVALGDLPRAQEAVRDRRPVAKTCGEPLVDPLADGGRTTLLDALVKDHARVAARLAEQLEVEPPMMMRIGQALAREGQSRAADRWYRRLLVEHPESEAARALLKREPARQAALDPDERRARMTALLEAHDNETAAAEAVRWLKEGRVPRCEAQYVAGKAYRKMRRYTPALSHLTQAKRICLKEKNRDLALRSALLESRVRAIRGDASRTKALAQWIEKRAPGHTFVDDAWFRAAEVTARKRSDAAARPLFVRVVERYPDSDHAPAAAWRLALDHLLAGQKAKAVPFLEGVKNHRQARPMDRARARYWTARLDRKTEVDALAPMVWPPSFYGWLALDELRRRHPKVHEDVVRRLTSIRRAPRESVTVPPAWQSAPELRRAAKLRRAELADYAVAELARLECRAKTAEEILALAAAYLRCDAGPRAQRVLRRHAGLFRDRDDLGFWRYAYSRLYRPEIEKAAAAGRVEPLLLTGLVREESTFDPEIISWAGATGLAQLMPATAVGAYADVYGGKLDLRRLIEPELNLRLGAHVLHQGMRAFRHPPLALSAYNGGHGLTRRFLPARPTPFETWVEQISVKETRRYVKRVVETWGIYRFLYDDEAPFIDLPDMIQRD